MYALLFRGRGGYVCVHLIFCVHIAIARRIIQRKTFRFTGFATKIAFEITLEIQNRSQRVIHQNPSGDSDSQISLGTRTHTFLYNPKTEAVTNCEKRLWNANRIWTRCVKQMCKAMESVIQKGRQRLAEHSGRNCVADVCEILVEVAWIERDVSFPIVYTYYYTSAMMMRKTLLAIIFEFSRSSAYTH